MKRDTPGPHPWVFVAGGLGDVARRFYKTTTYELLGEASKPITVLCYSHNPSAADFFRFHRNCQNLRILDVGHIYMSMLRRKVDKRLIGSKLLGICDLEAGNQMAVPRDSRPMQTFDAPDLVAPAKPYVVIHPFGRGWGDLPPDVVNQLERALLTIPADIEIYVICADYLAADGRSKRETFSSTLPNVRLMRNLSGPATFSLVAKASRFVGTMSCLAQVAAFEQVPSIILHPERCGDFIFPYSDYAKTIWSGNGIAMAFDAEPETSLQMALRCFLSNPWSEARTEELLAGLVGRPAF